MFFSSSCVCFYMKIIQWSQINDTRWLSHTIYSNVLCLSKPLKWKLASCDCLLLLSLFWYSNSICDCMLFFFLYFAHIMSYIAQYFDIFIVWFLPTTSVCVSAAVKADSWCCWILLHTNVNFDTFSTLRKCE